MLRHEFPTQSCHSRSFSSSLHLFGLRDDYSASASVVPRFQFLERFGGGRLLFAIRALLPDPKAGYARPEPSPAALSPEPAATHLSVCLFSAFLWAPTLSLLQKPPRRRRRRGRGASVNRPLLKHLPVLLLARVEIHSAQTEASPIILIHSLPSLPFPPGAPDDAELNVMGDSDPQSRSVAVEPTDVDRQTQEWSGQKQRVKFFAGFRRRPGSPRKP